MILELIATALLAYGVSTSCSNVNHGYSNDYNNQNNEISLVKTSPNYAAQPSNRIQGLYNFYMRFDFSSLEGLTLGYIHYFDRDYETYNKNCQFNAGIDNQMYYCHGIYLTYSNLDQAANIEFVLYDEQYNETSFICSIEQSSYLSDYNEDTEYLFFNVIDPIFLEGVDLDLFNLLFTHADNDFVTSYTGYYSLVANQIVYSNNSNVFGNFIINQRIYYTFNGRARAVDSYLASFDCLGYDVISTELQLYNFQFSSVKNNQVYFSVSKMSVPTYNNLSSLGLFGYIPQPTQSDFEDLLYTIMDTPIYFISSFLNFELFGMNLYIALSGLITLLVVVFIIRKIW